MELLDFIIVPISLLVIYSIALFFNGTVLKNTRLKSYFIPGLTVKLIGAFFFVLIYKYYYGYGDSITYYTSASFLTNNFYQDPINTIKALFTPLNQYSDSMNYMISKSPSNVAFRSESNFMVVRIGTILNFFGNTYLMTNLLFACISFLGVWKLFVACFKLYPNLHKGLAISILFVPTVFFWGSPMMKDSITIAALCYLFYSLNEIFIWKRHILSNIIIALVCAALLIIVKMYIIAAFVPAYLTFLVFRIINTIQNGIIRLYALPVFLVLLTIGSLYSTTQFGMLNKTYSAENLATSIEVVQKDILRNSSNDAAYTFGEIEFTPLGLAKVFPVAVITTFYRPFIWEVRNPVMLLSAIENTALIVLTFILFFKFGFWKVINTVRNHPFLYFCIIYSIILGFAIGLSTYNFGTLARYKAPLMPFFTMLVVLIYSLNKQTGKNRSFRQPSSIT